MNDKPNKDEFLEYIISMWKEGEISESALIKIRDMYYRENLRKQEEILDDKLQNRDKYKQNTSKNQICNVYVKN